MTEKPTAAKKMLYIFVVATPALLLTAVVLLVAFDLYSLRRVDPAVILRDLEVKFPLRAITTSPLPDKLRSLDMARKKVFIFGGSTLLLSDGGVFPDYLEEVGDNLQVVNLGVSGIDSFSVRERVRETLAVARPDLIVINFGHNDINCAYQGYILQAYFTQFDWLLRIPYAFSDNSQPVSKFAPLEFFWYKRLYRPRLFNAFQRLGLLKINGKDYEPINRLILDYFIRNSSAIMDMAAAQNIPVVFMTPIGNLRAEPYGDITTTTEWYRKGLATNDYDQAIKYLKMARDAELFTYDLRAKSAIVEYLRSIQRPNVYVLDLEKTLEKRHFSFGSDVFLDYFHFADQTHRLTADIIRDFLARNQLPR